jgi:hypothetical protein
MLESPCPLLDPQDSCVQIMRAVIQITNYCMPGTFITKVDCSVKIHPVIVMVRSGKWISNQ